MLDLVPLAGAGREMGHVYLEARLVGHPLQLPLPAEAPGLVGASPVGVDVDSPHVREGAFADRLPPAYDGLGGELGGVVADAEVDEPGVVVDAVDAVGGDPAELGQGEVVVEHPPGVAPPPVLAPAVFEIADQFLLFRVHGYDRVARGDELLGLRVDEAELAVAVRVRLADLLVLLVLLPAVAELLEPPADEDVADGYAVAPEQPVGDLAQAERRPEQGPFGVAVGLPADHGLYRLVQPGHRLRLGLPAPALGPDPLGPSGGGRGLRGARGEGVGRDAGEGADEGVPAVAERLGAGGEEDASLPLVEGGLDDAHDVLYRSLGLDRGGHFLFLAHIIRERAGSFHI